MAQSSDAALFEEEERIRSGLPPTRTVSEDERAQRLLAWVREGNRRMRLEDVKDDPKVELELLRRERDALTRELREAKYREEDLILDNNRRKRDWLAWGIYLSVWAIMIWVFSQVFGFRGEESFSLPSWPELLFGYASLAWGIGGLFACPAIAIRLLRD